MKTLLRFTLLLGILLPAIAPAADFVSKTGKITIKDLGDWSVKTDELQEDKRTVVTLTVPGENMHAEFKHFELGGFDVDSKVFQDGILNGLEKGGMVITTSYLGKWEGNLCFKVFATQAVESTTIHILSMSSFFGGNFVTLSVADDNPGVEGSDAVKHLLNNVVLSED